MISKVHLSRFVAGALAVSLLGGACSADASFTVGGQSVQDAAEDLIEGGLAEQLELELTADCPEVEDPEVGTEFSCTAETGDAETVQIEGVVDREDHIDLNTTNVVNPSAATALGTQAAGLIEEQTGGPVSVDCGNEAVVLNDDSEMRCEATSGDSERGVILTITDTSTGAFDLRME